MVSNNLLEGIQYGSGSWVVLCYYVIVSMRVLYYILKILPLSLVFY